MDSIPILVLTGQVPHLHDRLRRLPGGGHRRHHRPCTKANWLVKETDRLAQTLHEAFHVAGRAPRPRPRGHPQGVQFATGTYTPAEAHVSRYQPRKGPDMAMIEALVAAMERAQRPVFYTGGGVVNSGPEASHSCATSWRPRTSRSPRR
jgi:acetolactate synthase-1/2/3 large subunit